MFTQRIRTVLNESQLKLLEHSYSTNQRPDTSIKEQLVEQTGLSAGVIRVWFQNKRIKDKIIQIEQREKIQSLEKKTNTGTFDLSLAASDATAQKLICELCDASCTGLDNYRIHLQYGHNQLKGKIATDMERGAPVACGRCRERFWTNEGLDRHLLMSHHLVTNDLIQKAQNKKDGCCCKLCGKVF
uniref:Homeobox domain-containing protein n=1 Tax=Meloidogyne incognita TaxID=6306 RepID=A0A914NZL7_MELIC